METEVNEIQEQTEKKESKNFVDGYIGTYYSEQSRGIYRFSFDLKSGCLTEPELFYEARNAKWISLKGNSMVFPVEKQGCAGICFLELRDGKAGHAEEILEEKQTSCYILQEGAWVYTANYHEGTVMVYHLKDGKPSLVKRIENGEGAGCHQILLHETYLLVPCLEQDRIRFFDTAHDFLPAGEITFPDGSGPRHGVFNREHTKFYAVTERSNELFVFQVQGREFTLVQSVPLLPNIGDEKNREAAAAAIRLTEDGKFLYISIRGADALVIFRVNDERVEMIQHTSCGGVHPRDIMLSENEKFLLAANRFGGGIVSIERDRESGLLLDKRHWVTMPESVALAFENNHTEEAVL